MPRPVAFCVQIMLVMRICDDLYRQAFDDFNRLRFQSCDLCRVVSQQAYRADTHQPQHLRRHRKIAGIDGKTQPCIRIDGVKPLVLLGISAQLVDQANAAPFLPQIQQYAPIGLRHPVHCLMQLRAAVTFQAAQNVARQAFGMQLSGAYSKLIFRRFSLCCMAQDKHKRMSDPAQLTATLMQFRINGSNTNRNSKMNKIYSFIAALSLSSLLFSVTLV